MNRQHLVLVVLFLLSSIFSIHAQWDRIGSFQDLSNFDVGGTENIVLTAYISNNITSSQNGGEDWNGTNDLFEYCWFNDVDFATDSIAYACGGSSFGLSKNFIAKTTDGGITWDSLISNQSPGYDYKNINMINKDTGIISQQYKLYRTIDGFKNLENADFLDDNYKITDFDVYHNNIILLCRNREQESVSEYILKSTDVGISWDTIYHYEESNTNPEVLQYLASIQYYDNQHIYAVGADGLFLKTNDGGNSWETKNIFPYSRLSTIYFTSTDIGYINNAGGIYKTTNGGEDWSVQQLNPPSIINKILFINDTLGYALSDNRVFKTTTGGEITLSTEKSDFFPHLKIYPNPTSEFIIIEFTKTVNDLQLLIHSANGDLMQSEKIKDKQQVNVKEYIPGTYFVTILDKKSGRSKTEKLIIN